MKCKLLIVFYSKHGYVKRYVDILGNALGCDAVPAGSARAEMFADYDKVLYIGSLRGNTINGIKKFSEFYDIVYKKLVVCGVGMFPFNESIPGRIKDASVSVMYEKFVPVFYAQGGFAFDELSRLDRMSIATRVRQIQASGLINEEETFFMNAVKVPVDEVKQANIQPLIDYLDGKPVDDKMYSPPEITDPEQEKQFFAELEQAAKAPENKQRALKKKLKK